jgi:hypothetical protein
MVLLLALGFGLTAITGVAAWVVLLALTAVVGVSYGMLRFGGEKLRAKRG